MPGLPLGRWPVLAGVALFGAIACTSVDIGGPTAPKDAEDAGLLTLEDGRELAVYPEDLAFTGTAQYRWPSGERYDGTWSGGQRAGRGEQTLPDGSRYVGAWKADRRHGKGTLTLADGGRYEGEFKAGKRHGTGTLTAAEGDRYQGQWQDDAPHGRGRLQAVSGSVYDGDWFGGRRSGQGRYTDAQGNVYDGEWRNDAFHGHGSYRTERLRYDGSWAGGRRDGYGTLDIAGYLIFEGTWSAGRRNGFGVERLGNGSGYRGDWIDDKRDGEGRAWQADGTFHEGTWEKNLALGPGTRQLRSGIRISGNWIGDTVASGLVQLPSGLEYAGPLFDSKPERVEPELLRWLTEHLGDKDPHVLLLYAEAHLDYDEPERDYTVARRALRESARLGVAEAQYRLAELSLARAPEEAVDWLRLAAGQNHVQAAALLGELYQVGEHVPRDFESAASYYQTAMRVGDVGARNSLAWLLATCPDPRLRDGERALELIEPLATFTGRWEHLETLAAALAETGEYRDAAQTQERALEALAEEDDGMVEDLRTQMTRRLAAYRNGEAVRDSGV